MKDGSNSTATGRALEKDEFTNRKLIRPPLPKQQTRGGGGHPSQGERPLTWAEKPDRRPRVPALDQTHAEVFYYQKQMQGRTPIIVVLKDGEEVHGVLEWYDRECIKLSRGPAHLLIYKSNIKYIYKAAENGRR